MVVDTSMFLYLLQIFRNGFECDVNENDADATIILTDEKQFDATVRQR